MKKLIYILIVVFAFAFNVKAQTELVSTGSGSAYVINYPGAFSYSLGISVTFKAHLASTAGPVTLNINTLGAKTIKKNVTTDLALGDILLNQYVTVMYDGINFQMVTPSSNSASGFANTSLSNLITTSVNQSLIPDAANSRSLGSNALAWTDNYISGKLYVAGAPWTSTATNNTLIGTKGGEAFTSGVYNLGVGQGSGNLITTGVRNTVVGHRAGEALKTQNDNTFLGNLAGGLAVGVGNNNTFLGSYAGYGSTNTGSNNTFLGINVGGNNTSGNYNTYVGQNAGYIASSGGFNTVIGSDAGQNLTTGSTNTFIGTNTGFTTITQRTNATAIGYNTTVDADNALVLGNNANVGIGISSPTTILDIRDANKITSSTVSANLNVMTTDPQGIDIGGSISLGGYNNDAATVTRVYGTIEGRKITAVTGSSSGYLSFKTNNGGILTEKMRIDNSGNLGIGTTTPSEKLEVIGNIEIPAANDYLYATAKTRITTIPATAFVNPNAPVNYDAQGARIYYTGGLPVYAPLTLPVGAIITEVKWVVFDNTAAQNTGQLYRITEGASSSTLVSGTLSTNNGAVNNHSFSPNHTVLTNTAYTLRWTPTDNTQSLYMCVITYTVTQAE